MDSDSASRGGFVFLVGAGPGDPGLVTLRALEVLKLADVVVYDRLVSPEVLSLAKTRDLIYAGKQEGEHGLGQDEINQLLIRLASEGRKVCRLKGGDPFVFGRGGEEAAALAAAGIAFELVPGVTSAVAAPAYAGIPVTHRGLSSSFACVTAHEDPKKGGDTVDWDSLARGADTLVILMGSKRIGQIAARLVAAGLPYERPAAVIEAATLPNQRVIAGSLADIGGKAEQAGVGSPSVLVVGEVVSLAGELDWLQLRPLHGTTVLVTRDEAAAGRLSSALRNAGASVVTMPATKVLPLDDESELAGALGDLPSHDWVVFASANSVIHVFERLRSLGLDARALAGCKVSAMGLGTAESLAEHGILADFTPERYVSESLIAGLLPLLKPGSKVLILGARGGRTELAVALRAKGHLAKQVAAYRSEPAEPDSRALERLRGGEIDWVAFTSSSSVKRLVEVVGGPGAFPARTRIACIGPATAATAEAMGLPVTGIAELHTLDGLVDCIAGARALEAR